MVVVRSHVSGGAVVRVLLLLLTVEERRHGEGMVARNNEGDKVVISLANAGL